jgi:serine/threonine protein kinase
MLDERVKLMKIISHEIDRINLKQRDICMTGSKDCNLKSLLTDITEVGTGLLATVFTAKINGFPIAIKESYIINYQPGPMKIPHKKIRSDRINEKYYPTDYTLLSYINTLLLNKCCPNFYFTYGLSFCQGCFHGINMYYELFGKNKKSYFCYLCYLEPMDNVLPHDDEIFWTVNNQYSILYQVLLAVYSIHSTYCIVHGDIKKTNVLYKKIKPGGYFEYNVGNATYYVQNCGYLAILGDFGCSFSISPTYAMSDYYGSRNAEIKIDNYGRYYCDPIYCEGNKKLLWNDGYIGSVNKFSSKTTTVCSQSPIDLCDAKKFPPFEFSKDITAVIKMFIGGLPIHRHIKVQQLDPTLETKLLKLDVEKLSKPNFKWDIYDSVKYVRADVMLNYLYEKIKPVRSQIIDTFYIS